MPGEFNAYTFDYSQSFYALTGSQAHMFLLLLAHLNLSEYVIATHQTYIISHISLCNSTFYIYTILQFVSSYAGCREYTLRVHAHTMHCMH